MTIDYLVCLDFTYIDDIVSGILGAIKRKDQNKYHSIYNLEVLTIYDWTVKKYGVSKFEKPL